MPLTDVNAQRLVDEQIKGIEATISQLKLRILNLNSRRNLHCAVSKLPVEIIAEIFLEVNWDHLGHYPFGESTSSVSAVCRSWRAIALNTPRLWSSIDVTSVDSSRCCLMLQRSKSVPLHIQYVNMESWDSRDIRSGKFHCATQWQAVMSHLGRIQSLEIRSLTPQYLIEVLRLTKAELCMSKPVIPFVMPSLRTLTLYGVMIGNTFPLLPSLTHLDVSQFPVQPIPQLLRCLQNTPNIETLSLEGKITDVSSQHSTIARITLPKLRSLKISTHDFSSLKILDYLPRTASTIICFTCSIDDFEPTSLTNFKPAFSRFAFGSGEAVSIEHVALTVTDHDEVEVYIATSQPDEYFAVWFLFTDPGMGCLFTSLSKVLPLADAPSLHVTGFHTMNEIGTAWQTIFQPFERVNILRFCQSDDESMLWDLVKRKKSSYCVPFLPLPALREIHFEDCCEDGDNPSVDLSLDWRAMRRIVSQRKDLGISVQFYWDGSCFTDEVEEGL